MNTLEAIEKRRSNRMYKTEKLEEDILLSLIRSATLAPSAKNMQPWFFEILDEEKLKLVTTKMKEYFNRPKEEIHPYSASARFSARIMERSGNVILVYRRRKDEFKYEDLLAIGAAIENMLLTATDRGLGSLWIRDTFWAEKEILEALGRTDYELVSAVALGHNIDQPEARPRKNLDEVVLK